ncbi:MAG: type II toxin-antitoxin system HigB family toxin [Saprospiraceae bacterium]
MKIIGLKTLKQGLIEHPSSKGPLLAWKAFLEAAHWENPADLKKQFGAASIVSDRRVVFNIHRNKFKLITDIEYRLKIVFIVWFCSKTDFDFIDVKKIQYVQSD